MKRRFALPATIALMLHAILFLGSSRPPARGGAVHTTPPTMGDPLPPEVVEIIAPLPPEPIEMAATEDARPEGDYLDGPPRGLEVPMPEGFKFDASTITQDFSRAVSGHGKNAGVWNLGVPGGKGAEATEALSIRDLDNHPVSRFRRSPAYPAAMRSAGISGTVWVEFVVDERGKVSNVHVSRSTNTGFVEATILAVSEWRFEPGTRRGLPVKFKMSVPVVFNLGE